MDDQDRIDLAHAPAFRISVVEVLPSTREVVGADGTREIVEPRVMQVLVALARANGAMVSRDDLTRSCWEGRIVGEDAINRIISRLRRVAEGIGGQSFRIETVTKVGYRLVEAEPVATGLAASHPSGITPAMAVDRRRWLVGGGAALGLAAVGGAVAFVRTPRPTPPAPSQAALTLMEQGMTALRQITGEGNAQALGLFRQVTALAPNYGEGWGALAMTYAVHAHYHPPEEAQALIMRARSAADRALAIDPDNVHAQLALAGALPTIGHWRGLELVVGRGLRSKPDDDMLLSTLATTLACVGRMREAAAALDHAVSVAPPSPLIMYRRVLWLWSANRLDEADAALDQARQLFPLHFALWFARLYLNLYAGRVSEAIRFSEDRDGRPPGIAEAEFERPIAFARVVAADDQPGIDRVLAENLASAHIGTGYAENSFLFAAFTGRFDMAFAIADAYFLDRGFTVPPRRFASGQGTYTGLPDRRTWILFQPPAQSLWRDPRFDRLLDEVGLTRYWRDSGTKPDYRT